MAMMIFQDNNSRILKFLDNNSVMGCTHTYMPFNIAACTLCNIAILTVPALGLRPPLLIQHLSIPVPSAHRLPTIFCFPVQER